MASFKTSLIKFVYTAVSPKLLCQGI